MRKLKVVISGGLGQIGSHVAEMMLERGDEVVVIDNEYSDAHDQFYWNESEKVSNYHYDIRDYENTRPLYDGVDYVFHIAAEARIQPAIKNPIEAVSINSVGTCTVLQCARESGVKRVMYSSTSSGYGMNLYPNVETQPDDCLNPYSASKVAAEKFCKMYTDLYGLKTVVFRYFNVYGKGEEHKGNQASPISKFTQQAKEDRVIKVFEDSEYAFRDFVCVDDVVNVVLDNTSGSGIYDIGTGEPISFEVVAELIAEKEGAEIETIPFPLHLKNKYQEYTCADNSWYDYKYTSVKAYLQA